MTDSAEKKTKKEYFTACFAAILTSTVGMFLPEEGEDVSRSLALLGIIALLMVVVMYFKLGRDGDGDSSTNGEPGYVVQRMRRMTYLWYVLTLVLAGALVRGPLGQIMSGSLEHISRLDSLSAAFGFVAICFAIWKILFLGRKA